MEVFTGTSYRIIFSNYDGVELPAFTLDIPEHDCAMNLVESFNIALVDVSEDDLVGHAMWPKEAFDYKMFPVKNYRPGIAGVDFGKGRGSVKRRFGGMRVPRSAYQLNGEQ